MVDEKYKKDEWEYPEGSGTRWKHCPNCKKPIKAEWTEHKICGWGVSAQAKKQLPNMLNILQTCVRGACDSGIAKDTEELLKVATQLRNWILEKLDEE